MPRYNVVHGDVMLYLERYVDDKFHAFLFDPPYGFDNGFMGEQWDREPIVFGPEFWNALSNVGHPGALGFAFTSAENQDRISTAIRDSGLEILPRMFLWATNRAMPRYRRISDTHVYGKLSIKPSVEPIVAFRVPGKRKEGAGTYNVGGISPSADGKVRFPSSLILDENAERELGDRSKYFSRLMTESECLYYDKASRRERDIGLEDFPDTKVGVMSGRRDGSMGIIPMGKNDHPTVKPVRLARHLASLILPPPLEVPRKLFIPFSGTGSEQAGAILAGWDNVVGVEQSERYVNISNKRIPALVATYDTVS